MPTYHHGDLKRALLETAMEAFAKEGESALSLRALARHIGVSPGAPYRHYRDKSSLVAAIVAAGFERLRRAVLFADEEAEAGRKVIAQAIAYVAFAKANPKLFRLMFGAPRTDPDAIASAEAAYNVLTARLRRSDPSDADLPGRTLAYWSLMHGLAILTIDGQIADKGASDTVVSYVFALLDRQLGQMLKSPT